MSPARWDHPWLPCWKLQIHTSAPLILSLSFISFPFILILIQHTVYWCVLFTVCVPSLKCKLPQGKDFCTFCSLLYPQCLGQSLAHRRCLINMFRVSGWLWVWKNLVYLGNRSPVHETGWADGGGQERRLERWAEGRHMGLVGHRKVGGFYPKHNRRPSKGFKQRRDIIQPENFIYFFKIFIYFFLLMATTKTREGQTKISDWNLTCKTFLRKLI